MMFHFRDHPTPYTIQMQVTRHNLAGPPHSETLGSQPFSRLPEEYRGPPRPSSADAKASTERSKKQSNKDTQLKQKQFCRRNLYDKCSRPLYGQPTTPSSPPPLPASKASGDWVRQPSAPWNPDSMPPHTRKGTRGACHSPHGGSRNRRACFLRSEIADKPTTTHARARTSAAVGRQPSAGQTPATRPIQLDQTARDQEATRTVIRRR